MWLLPRSFKLVSADDSDVGALSNDPEGARERLMADESAHEHEHFNRIELQTASQAISGH